MTNVQQLTLDLNPRPGTIDLLFDHFDQLVTHPADIPPLREMILQLAVQGKLVPQDPDDELASELLRHIEDEKKLMLEQQNIKLSKRLPPIKDTEIPYQIPKGWMWVRLGDIINFVNGYSFKSKDFLDEGVGVVRIRDIQNGMISEEHMKFVPNGIAEKVSAEFRVNPGDLLIAMSGATTGKLGFNSSTKIYLLNQRIGKIETILVDKFYVCHYLRTKAQENLSISAGSAIPNLSTSQIKNSVFPLPPLAEQKRIVAKVESLLAQLQQLEAELAAAEQAQITLNQAALHHLLAAPTPAETQTRWDLIAANFDLLYSDPANVDDLKQAILQLAVQGKLVPQDPVDEPASVLLEHIASEKERLIEEGKIKKSKLLPPVGEDEIPYELPEGWEWVRLFDMCQVINDGDHQPPPKTDSGIPFLVISNIRTGTLDFNNTRFVPEDYFDQLDIARRPLKGDILYSIVGSLGIPVLVDTDRKFCFQRHIAVFRPAESIDRHYLYFILMSPLVLEQGRECATGIAQKTIPMSGLRKIVAPLPPLAEQKRIVAKVDALLGQCEALQSALAQAGQSREKALAAVVGGVVGE